ncbi:hypothetical protein A3F58_02170 [Candidatus Roizmanbacteria bacterium RIFCSPHIGHO2_12_FULL_37_9b]|uniref:Uncharacterized protein n=1 Tax=Candidatus Roizmanbacteria bacterium RIFCSPHIGHO2_02_FULL_38_11 TaxID=1802039 RepID=A0A1F7H0K4_9BACT|nr:MAG: hypothetical protein A3C25_06085 [Candidatus Roizmanbacteria bacterium RIFCSPHIGHO2_02_FULL_38_11]OGK33020.1 MAG: hypothetical protein A3F58_02170 [Candidatus Roizmanbacteria bacterium RIFCSPHIGHO2_12_FULL_37_9b]
MKTSFFVISTEANEVSEVDLHAGRQGNLSTKACKRFLDSFHSLGMTLLGVFKQALRGVYGNLVISSK